jgi:hypothetical protein
VARVYLSSTKEDLASFRAEVCAALRRLRHEVVAMEDYTARSGRPLDECLADVRSCDVVIAIVAWRQGFVPRGHTQGISQLEIEEAEGHHKVILPFLLHEEEPWPPHFIDDDKRAVVAWRARLQRDFVVEWFRTPADLANRVSSAITNALHADEPPEGTLSLTAERRRFLCQCLRKYLSEMGVQKRVYLGSSMGLALTGALALLAGLFALEAEKGLIVGAGSLVLFSASVFPLVPFSTVRSKRTLLELCVADLEGDRPSAESVRFATQLLDRVILR